MKLKGFVWCVLALAVLVLFLQVFVFSKSQGGGSAASYFVATLVLLGTGLELVRSELADLRRAMNR
jgi:hypothetical protein